MRTRPDIAIEKMFHSFQNLVQYAFSCVDTEHGGKAVCLSFRHIVLELVRYRNVWEKVRAHNGIGAESAEKLEIALVIEVIEEFEQPLFPIGLGFSFLVEISPELGRPVDEV